MNLVYDTILGYRGSISELFNAFEFAHRERQHYLRNKEVNLEPQGRKQIRNLRKKRIKA